MTDRAHLTVAPIKENTDLRLKPPATKAGGWAAILSSQRYIIREVGFWAGNRSLLHMNQRQGFDCPGCAWPDPQGHRSPAEFCENGAKALAEEATSRLIGRDFFQKHSIEQLSQWSDYELGQAGRIAEPLVLKAGATHYEPISWPQAAELVANHLKSIDTSQEAIFYTSGRASNEAAYLYQLFVRCLGSNHLPDCSNLCHESSGRALGESIGIGKGTVTLEDFEQTELIVIVGQNPGTNHPRMLSALRQAAQNGARIISINPLFEAGLKRFQHPQKVTDMLAGGVDLAKEHYAIRINGDLALFQGIGKHLLSQHPEGLDPAFIKKHTEAFEQYRSHLAAQPWSELEQQSGLNRTQIVQLAEHIANAKTWISCWAMGLTQGPQAVATIRELCNLHLLGGFIGKPGSGLCPVRGHSNVQGDRSVGICERPPAWLARMEQHYGQAMPRKPGYDVVDAIKAMKQGKAKMLMCLGGNFLSAAPDTEATATGLQTLELSVQISTKLNRSHLITGSCALILPCLARSEQDWRQGHRQYVTVENSMGYVHKSTGVRQPRSSHWRSEVAIIAEIADKTLGSARINWQAMADNYHLIRQDIEAVIPDFRGMCESLAKHSGFYLPNPPRDERRFPTASGRAVFSVCQRQEHSVAADHFVLMTIRSHDQFNTTIYGLDDRYRGVFHGRRVILINGQDMAERGLWRNQEVDVCSHFQGQRRWGRQFRLVPYDIPRGMLASYFPEANVLVPLESFAPGSQTPTSKFIEVSLHPISEQQSSVSSANSPQSPLP